MSPLVDSNDRKSRILDYTTWYVAYGYANMFLSNCALYLSKKRCLTITDKHELCLDSGVKSEEIASNKKGYLTEG